jgi:hypothetical protein
MYNKNIETCLYNTPNAIFDAKENFQKNHNTNFILRKFAKKCKKNIIVYNLWQKCDFMRCF